MLNVTESKLGRTIAAVVFTVLFSSTMVLTAVGPAEAGITTRVAVLAATETPAVGHRA